MVMKSGSLDARTHVHNSLLSFRTGLKDSLLGTVKSEEAV